MKIDKKATIEQLQKLIGISGTIYGNWNHVRRTCIIKSINIGTEIMLDVLVKENWGTTRTVKIKAQYFIETPATDKYKDDYKVAKREEEKKLQEKKKETKKQQEQLKQEEQNQALKNFNHEDNH